MKFKIYNKENLISINTAKELEKRLQDIGFVYHEFEPDIVISIGGDGTFLRAVHEHNSFEQEILFVGIHTGRLGFYCDWQVEDLDDLMYHIQNGHKNVVEYPVLEHEIHRNGQVIIGYSLNEITIINPVQTQIVDLFINDELFETVNGTGICVSTPSGSSAYNKSLGGAVVDPLVNSIQITEMAPITNNAYRALGSPILLGPTYQVTLQGKDFSNSILTSDHKSFYLKKNDVVICRICSKKIKVVMHKSNSFWHRVKKSFLNGD